MKVLTEEEFLILCLKYGQPRTDSLPISRNTSMSVPYKVFEVERTYTQEFNIDYLPTGSHHIRRHRINADKDSVQLYYHNNRYYIRINDDLMWVYFVEDLNSELYELLVLEEMLDILYPDSQETI